MNKTALKTFATNARIELLKKVEMKALELGITEEKIKTAQMESSDAVFIDGRQLAQDEKLKRDKLIERINELGFTQVMEEVAYTWFNRFCAIRFMEVNDYLPTRVRALSSTDPHSREPDMMKEAASLNLDVDKQHIYELKMDNKLDELFKYLIMKLCNDLNRYMPFMFEKIEDYTEILFPDGLLAPDSFLRTMTNTEIISEDDWKQIEIIGWLYQYYIADEKDRVFQHKKKFKEEEIPFVTQLFTPDWIVRYMVQNGLGRYWVEAHPEHEDLLDNWEFYIKRDENFHEKLKPFINKDIKVEQIKFLDPAMGSGHILVYAFDLFYEIYEKCGYLEREIPKLIIENNLYGLDIDDRAYQLACFSLVMKGMEKNRRFLRSIEREGLQLNLASIQETNDWTEEHIAYVARDVKGETYTAVKTFVEQFHNGKIYGSLINVTTRETLALLEERLNEIKETEEQDLFQMETRKRVLQTLPRLIKQAKIMSEAYDVITLNPPYMGANRMNEELAKFLRKHYPNSKADLFAAFMEVDHLLKENGFYAAINQHSWMFLSSFEKLRETILENSFVDSMLHLGPRAFEEIGGEVVQSTTFVLRKTKMLREKGVYIRLVDERTAKEKRDKAIEAIQKEEASYKFTFDQENFKKIPSCLIAYWVSKNFIDSFHRGEKLRDVATIFEGIKTRDNKRFLRFWYEVSSDKWKPYAKGGEFRRWYGNNDYVLNWGDDGSEVRNFKKSSGANFEHYFTPTITYSALSSYKFSGRFINNSLFGGGGGGITNVKQINYVLGFLNSNVADYMFSVISPTLNFEVGQIGKLPIIFDEGKRAEVDRLVDENMTVAKRDWDFFETSVDFKKHPFLYFPGKTIAESFEHWQQFTDEQFQTLKKNEEKINEIFIDIYRFQEEIRPEVLDEDVSIRKADLERDIKSFISYAIGCAFGRYTLDEEGLVYARGQFDLTKYKTFPADEDNILPILPGAYFDDDIVNRFIHFVKVVYGEDMLEENLLFIASALGKRKNETSRETLRRYFLNDFYKDHVRTYKKCPIYWLFTSGKEKAFNCLIYMHRYDKTTISRIRTDYLHEVQTRYETVRDDLVHIIDGNGSASEIREAKKQLKSIDKKIDELKAYDEKLHHMADMQIEMDLDDGVKVNYEKLKGLLAKW